MLTAIICDLTREIAIEKMDDLIELSNQTFHEFAQAPWTKDNFLYELPHKWDLSVYASYSDKLIGCLIGYERNEQYGPKAHESFAFIPAVMLQHDFRGNKATTPEGKKLGYAMMERYHSKSSYLGIMESRLGVLAENKSAFKMYEKLGYGIIGTHEGVDGKSRLVMSKYIGG